MPVFTETGRQGTDIQQVIGMHHDEAGQVAVVLVNADIQQIQLHVFLQQVFQVVLVAVVAGTGIVNQDERVLLAVGGG
ncbi:MAG: hypothetical protein PUD08_05740 [bacterium]|nr:hypothetical protein [bacterium]